MTRSQCKDKMKLLSEIWERFQKMSVAQYRSWKKINLLSNRSLQKVPQSCDLFEGCDRVVLLLSQRLAEVAS